MDNHDYACWLSRLSYDPQLNGSIKLLDYIIRTDSMEDLCERVFPLSELRRSPSPDFFADRAILIVLNVSLKQFNNRILDCIPSDSRTYYATDKASTDEVGPDGFEEYPREYLRSIDVPGIAPSVLRLKVSSPIMLLRNLRIKDGLSNSTRMVVTALREHVIEAVILNGLYKGHRHCIPRIPMTSLDNDLPFRLTRTQFPVCLCFAITVNKSQGQSLSTVGIDLRVPAFSHGQLYVALSRVTDVSRMAVLIQPESETTQNMVYNEVLSCFTAPI